MMFGKGEIMDRLDPYQLLVETISNLYGCRLKQDIAKTVKKKYLSTTVAKYLDGT